MSRLQQADDWLPCFSLRQVWGFLFGGHRVELIAREAISRHAPPDSGLLELINKAGLSCKPAWKER